MTLVNPTETLKTARAEGWAVGGFNAYNLESARAVVTAADELSSPVMVQFSPGAIAHAGHESIVAIVRELASQTPHPVALHLDHGKDPELAKAAVSAGFTSVMIDTSHYPLDKNIAHTREIVRIAEERGVAVEAELGQISGIEDIGDVDVVETLTVPEEAARFVAETGVDSLAVAIGTAHGAVKFKGEPNLDFERLSRIAELVDVPLVLHGASAMRQQQVDDAERYGARFLAARGIPSGFIRKAIGYGISKINTDSDLRLAALGAIRRTLTEKPDLFNMYQLMGKTEDAIKQAVRERIQLFGSAGKA